MSIDCNNLWHKLDTNRLYIPDVSELRQEVIPEFHDPPYRGHFGIAKTLKAITSNSTGQRWTSTLRIHRHM
jgi:Integrase zinc binding domain